LIRAEISVAALQSNLARVRAEAPHSRVLAVVKADAYGHGGVAVARALAGADGFGVARIEEALQLRAAGIAAPLLLMEGVVTAEQLLEAARHDLQLVVHEPSQLALLEHAPAGPGFVVWLKIDTGMNRLGFRAGDFPAALARLKAWGPRVRELRFMTHFASADEPQGGDAPEQVARFEQVTAGHPQARSLAGSAGIFALPRSHADWVRPGICLYGVSPFAGRDGADLGLQPVMRLVSTVIAVRDVPMGEGVGYSAQWRASRASRIAILAAGYADGLMRLLPNGTPVLVNGARAGLVGRVSMDMIAVDVTALPGVKVGDEAVLWGAELPVEQMAAAAGTNGYELLCAVSARVPRQMT
jgi:alanine racemase